MLIVYLVSFVVHFLDANLNVNYSCNAMIAWLFYSFTFVYINVFNCLCFNDLLPRMYEFSVSVYFVFACRVTAMAPSRTPDTPRRTERNQRVPSNEGRAAPSPTPTARTSSFKSHPPSNDDPKVETKNQRATQNCLQPMDSP